jgi:hypothetical protein
MLERHEFDRRPQARLNAARETLRKPRSGFAEDNNVQTRIEIAWIETVSAARKQAKFIRTDAGRFGESNAAALYFPLQSKMAACGWRPL